MIDSNKCLKSAEEKMEMALMHLEDVLSHIRAGKANPRILDNIRVNSYGAMSPLSNVASITVPDAKSISSSRGTKTCSRK